MTGNRKGKYNRLIRPAEELSAMEVPLYGSIAAGYPSEAYNYIEDRIDLNKSIIRNKSGNRCLWVTNRELLGEGIEYGDMLVVDTKLNPANDSVVCLYLIEGEYQLRWIERINGGIQLVSPNPDVPLLFVAEGETVERVATLTHRLKKFSNYRRQYGGYPVDVTGYIEKGIDYNKYFFGEEGYWETHFFLRVEGESMTGDGIVKNDLLVVDRLGEQYEDSILVFLIENNFTLKRIIVYQDYVELVGSNPKFPRIRVAKETKLEAWGIVTGTVTEYLKNYEVLHSCRLK